MLEPSVLDHRRPQCQPGGHGLLHQMADGRFVGPVATHELLHDRFGQELIKRRLVGGGWADAVPRAVPPPGFVCALSRIRLHYSTTIV